MAMHLRVVCPENLAFEGDAVFITIPADDGIVGLAPRHASEIGTITPGYVRVCDERMGQVDHVIAVAAGYAQVADDEVVVLAERAADMATVDPDQVQAKLKGFEDQLSVLSETDAHRAYLYNEIAWCKLLLDA